MTEQVYRVEAVITVDTFVDAENVLEAKSRGEQAIKDRYPQATGVVVGTAELAKRADG